MSKRKAISIDLEQEEEEFSDDDEWCRMEEEDNVTVWDDAWNSDGDDAWCRDMELPSAKRPQVHIEEEEEEEEEENVNRDEDHSQQSGGALFEFALTTGSMPRRWKNIVNKTRYTSRLVQRREATRDDHMGQALTEALRQALLRAIAPEKVQSVLLSRLTETKFISPCMPQRFLPRPIIASNPPNSRSGN